MADYNANIRVNADTKAAERAIDALQKRLEKLDIGTAVAKSAETIQRKVSAVSIPLKVTGIEAAVQSIGLLQTGFANLQKRANRIQINDSQIQAAINRASTLRGELKELTGKKHIIQVEYQEQRTGSAGRGISPQEIAKRARDARAGGLSAQAAAIIGRDVAGENTQAVRSQLLNRLGKGSLGSGGYNLQGLKKIVADLGGNPVGKREDLVAQAKTLVSTVQDDIVSRLGKNLLDIRMKLEPLRGARPNDNSRSTPNFNEIVGRMASATTRPATALKMLKSIPEQYISTDIAGLASKQRDYYDTVPSARQFQIDSGKFDPLLKAIAESFATYTKSLSPTNPWIGKIGSRINTIVNSTANRALSGSLSLPAAGGSSSNRMTRSAMSGLPSLTAPRFGALEDERYIRSMSRYLQTANAALNGIANDYTQIAGEVKRQKSVARQVSEALLKSQRLLPPAGATGGGGGGELATIPTMVPYEGYGQGLNAITDWRERRNVRNRTRRAEIRRVREQNRAAGTRAESIALGVGFPLLFGGGAGTVGGSLAGSFVGSGFGGQILGGAIGQAIDQFIIKVTDLGKALADPTRAFDALKEASLISSKALEREIEKLQESGFAATASARAQEDFARSVGTNGVEALLAAGSASDRLGRAFAQLGVQMQALAAGPIAATQNRFADVVGAQASFSRAAQVSSALRRNGNTTAADRLDNATTRFSLSPNNTLGLDPGKIRQGMEKAIAEAEKSLPPVKIRLSAKQIREELISTLGKQLEALDTSRGLAAQVRNQARAQLDTDQQRYELIQSSERTIADLRRGIEDRITQQRLTNIQRENELLNTQAEIRLQSLRNNNIGLRSGFTNDQVSSAAGAVADYLEREQEIQNQIDQQKRDTQLEIQRISIETEQYKIQVAQQVARLNEDNAKRIAEINKGVRRANEDNDTRRFNIEKQIAVIKLKMLADELAVASRDLSAPVALRQASVDTYNGIKGRITAVENLQAPAQLKQVAGAPRYGASTAGADATAARGTELLGNLQAARTALLDLVRAGNLEQLKAQLSETLGKPLQKAANDAQQVWNALKGKGLGGQSTEAATRNAALTDLTKQLGELKTQTQNAGVQQLLQGYIDLIPDIATASDEIRINADLLSELNTKYIELQDTLLAAQSPYGQLTEVQRVRNTLLREGLSLESAYAQEVLKQAAAVDALQQQVRLATQLQDVWQGVGNAMGEAMTTGVTALVNGTQTAQQVFAQFLQGVGQALSSAAQQMIATYVAIGIAKLFAGLGGGGGGGGGNPSGMFGPGAPTEAFAGGGLFTGAGPFQFRAAGGPVTGSSPYVVGERGPELFIPGTGGSVVPTNDLRAAMGAGPGTAGGTPILNMSFESTNIGGVEYVSRDQLEAAMAATRRAASHDGAKRGMSMTLDKLQQSPSTRNRVGLR